MKYVIFSDVHGNLEVLKTLRKTRDYKTADVKVCLGDAIKMCPYSQECTDLILKDGCFFIKGNHESNITNDVVAEEFEQYKKTHSKYIKSNLRPDTLDVFKSMPIEITQKIAGKKILFTHYAHKKNGICKTSVKFGTLITKDFVARKFKPYKEDIIFYGHEHAPSIFFDKEKVLVGVGSLGATKIAHYCTMTVLKDKIVINRKSFKFNHKKVQREMRKMNYPSSKFFANFFN